MKQVYLTWKPKVRFVTFLIVLLFSIPFTSTLQAQFTAGTPAIFGIDGDIYPDLKNAGSTPAPGTHDWFSTLKNPGIGLFDVSDSIQLRNTILASGNYTFARRMRFDEYSVRDNYLLIDGMYTRDYVGNNKALDKTVFLTGTQVNNKNAQDPSTWITKPSGDVVPSKADIIDAFIHLRRDGTSILSTNPSHLIVTVASSVLATGGDHHIDFELFKNELDYNQATGIFNAIGPAVTGGRNVWEFNADGSVKNFGELSISFSFNNTTVSDIAIYIWVSEATFNNKNAPQSFSFTNDWNASTTNPLYGYARIIPKSGITPSWASVNNMITDAPVFGTYSKDIGDQGSNYFSTKYSVGQFAEAAVDLTEMGVDPALGVGMNKCAAPYKRVLIKTRSSSSFSSALQDFAGPFAFFDAPYIPAEIATPTNIGCSKAPVQLSALNNINGAFYSWTTADGNILSGNNTAVISVNKPGTYQLTTSIYDGCGPSTSSVTIYEDFIQPTATAITNGVLNEGNPDPVMLVGGDESQSNVMTPYGGSAGLIWNWTGPSGFTASSKNAQAFVEGEYRLVLTELRNGCTDTAFVTVLKKALLPMVLRSFTGTLEEDKTILKWVVDENHTGEYFEIQQSSDGKNFVSIFTILATEKRGSEIYSWSFENKNGAPFYRLLFVNKNHTRSYSKVIQVGVGAFGQEKLQVLQNPVASMLRFNYQSPGTDNYIVTVYDVRGIKLMQVSRLFNKGMNYVSLPADKLSNGNYYLEVTNKISRVITRFIK